METVDVNIKNWKSLIKPGKLDVQLSEDKSHAKIIAEPLEKGYGLTLGNSLRRILLSSIRGAAVTSIQIDGVLHEFTSIKGIREDVTDIVLNVKSLALKSSSEVVKKLILDVKGPGEIKASDITDVTDIEILNPDLVICNLDENTNFHMEMTVGTGKGYIPASMNKPEEPPLGLIAIDSLFSPVKKVSYSISTAREGKALDYDKLTWKLKQMDQFLLKMRLLIQLESFKINLICLLILMSLKKLPYMKYHQNLSLIKIYYVKSMN